MSEYWVMHDYGEYEGWKVVAKCATLREAVKAREADIASAGGTVEILERIETTFAYYKAHYERDDRKGDE